MYILAPIIISGSGSTVSMIPFNYNFMYHVSYNFIHVDVLSNQSNNTTGLIINQKSTVYVKVDIYSLVYRMNTVEIVDHKTCIMRTCIPTASAHNPQNIDKYYILRLSVFSIRT